MDERIKKSREDMKDFHLYAAQIAALREGLRRQSTKGDSK